MIERLKITHFYTTPSSIRYLMKDPEKLVNGYKGKLSSLKLIATGISEDSIFFLVKGGRLIHSYAFWGNELHKLVVWM